VRCTVNNRREEMQEHFIIKISGTACFGEVASKGHHNSIYCAQLFIMPSILPLLRFEKPVAGFYENRKMVWSSFVGLQKIRWWKFKISFFKKHTLFNLG
jgi:hypothetical protein